MDSSTDALMDPLKDIVEPPSPKRLKLTTDVLDPPLTTEAVTLSSLSNQINVTDGDEPKTLKGGNSSRMEVSKNEDNSQHSFSKVQEVAGSLTPKEQPPDASLDDDRISDKLTESPLRNEINPSATNESTLVVPGPTPVKVNQLPSLKSPAERRRDALRGIVMGIKSPDTLPKVVLALDHDKLSSDGPELILANNEGAASSNKQDEPHVVKRRAPKKDPKPRLPLENRVLYSKKEMDSATSFLAEKDDLNDCLPLDDCFLLGEMFWIFTVQQLELALDETSDQNLVQDMITKFSSTSMEPNVTRITALGQSSSGSPSREEIEPSNVDLQTSADIVVDLNANADAVVDLRRSANIVVDVNANADAVVDFSTSAEAVVDLSTSADTLLVDQTDKASQEMLIPFEGQQIPATQDIETPQQLSTDSKQSVAIVAVDGDAKCGSMESTLAQDTRTNAAANDNQSASKIYASSQPESNIPPLDDANLVKNADDNSLCIDYIPSGEDMIKERISFWREKLAKFRNGGVSSTQIQKRFILDGPIKLLFPQATINFFKSIKLETLWTFLALRKSETGAVCDLMHIWRRECKMSVVPDIGLGRHFLAIAARVETVLSAFPPIPERDRGWILDPISGITGAAHDFLIRDHKIMSGVEFLGFKTKQLADVLEVWRQENGMEKLRGSGKVAMISAWKAYIKEALEVESNAGTILDLSKYVAMVQNEKFAPTTTIEVPGNGKAATTVEKPITNHKKGTSELLIHSKMVLERVLGEGAIALLRSGGVQTAAELFAVDTSVESHLYKTLAETGIVDGLPAFKKAIQRWRDAIILHLQKDPYDSAPTQTAFSSIKNSIHTTVASPADLLPRKTVTDSAAPNRVISLEKDERDMDSAGSRKEKPIKPYQSSKILEVSDDPVYNILSYTTKQFLASMGVYTAEELLKSRSTDLAVHFVPWRRSMGKPELKGMGSIASISGWKSQVRKKAKELGLVELAELEPSTRGAKRGSQQQNSSKEGTKDVDVLDDDIVDNDIDITQHGEGLAKSRRELFSVQHKNVLYQNVFELSTRSDKAAITDNTLYITFKGATARKITQLIAKKIQLKIISEENQDYIMARPAYILPDVPVSSKRKYIFPPIDDDLMFQDSVPASVGLIDISLHGAFPYQDQDLDLLKMVMKMFTIEGHSAKLDEFVGNSHEIYNVVVRRTRLDNVQYLLYLPITVESGHTIKVIFPTIKTALCLQSYQNSDFAIMHKIDESIATLSVPDLQQLVTWIRESADSLHSTTQSDIEKSANLDSLVRQKRLYWLERRLLAALELQKVSNKDSLSNADDFKCQCSTFDVELTKQDIENSNVWIDEIAVQLKYALDLDVTCGSMTYQSWNTLAKSFFDDVIVCVARCLSKSRIDGFDWSPLQDLINSTIRPTVIVENNDNSISPDRNDNQMEIDDAAASTDKSHSSVAATKTSPSQISYNFIWQVLNSVSDVLRIDILRRENTSTLSTCLASIHSILFDSEAIVQDPILTEFEANLSYVSPMIRSDIDYVPNTKMLFLGLVWPVLRNFGWCIVFNSNESYGVSYMPKAMSLKRRGAMKQLRDRQRVKTKHALKVAGFHLVSKTAKRLLVAITSKAPEDDDTDVVYDQKYTVEAILDKFLVSVLESFTLLKDFAKFKVNEIARRIVVAMGECFDSCASMLPPITTLSPCWNVDGASIRRPIAAYRCEYLVPFLFYFISKAAIPASPDDEGTAIGDNLHGLALDILTYICEHHQEFFHPRFQPSAEEYVLNDAKPMWIETHIHSLLSEHELKSHPADTSMSEPDETTTTIEGNVSSEPKIFQVLLDEEKDQVTDFVRLTLENTKPVFVTGAEIQKRSTRPLGAPGLVCQHCSGKYGEGKYFFSSMESLSTCYPVLEKHYYKCPDTPSEIKAEVAKARALHIPQRRLKPNGSQQAVFVKLWNRMMQSKPGISLLLNRSSSNVSYNENDAIDDDFDDNYNIENDVDENEVTFTDHRAVIHYIRSGDYNVLSKPAQMEIEDALDTYYACIEYAGRVYGTTSMPDHFSTRWLLHKMTALGQQPVVSPSYNPSNHTNNKDMMRIG